MKIIFKGVNIMVNKVAFIGAGSMAEAIMAGMVNTNCLKGEQIYVANKENVARLQELEEKYHIIGNTDKAKVIHDADIIIFATKPYDMEKAIISVKDLIEPHQLIISVVAGVSTAFIASKIEKEIAVIRSMPNTSATIGYSATAISKGEFATDEHIAVAKKLFEAVGTVSVVDEEKMHIVTGISGSGPAYVYYLVEAMEKAAVAEGLDPATAKQLITQTIIGAGNMLKHSNEPVSTLRAGVTSPNGTTAAGIRTLEQYNVKEAVIECVKSATNRSKELGSEN